MTRDAALPRALGPLSLWSLGVGYVISGMYFGWNLGLPEGGSVGMLVATLLVTLLYAAFVLGYSELACAMPGADGAFLYARRGLGPAAGMLAGAAQWIEFVFAPPAIAAAIGAYVHNLSPLAPELAVAALSYLLFTALNIHGVRQSAAFELAVTALAVVELLVFAGAAAPHVSFEAFSRNALPHGPAGVLGAVPYAIWFYLAIEGLANTAEEARDPGRDLGRGFGVALLTLVALALLTFGCAVSVGGWEKVVYPPGSTTPSDSPLPLALAQIVSPAHPLYRLLTGMGLLGLVASFHGILLVAGRATFALGRAGYAPAFLGHTLERRKTPARALLVNLALGLVALFTGRTGDLITLSVFGALTLYVLSMLSLCRLRRLEPDLPRPFLTPLYPLTPAVALLLSLGCLGAMVYSQPGLSLIFFALLAAAFVWYWLVVRRSLAARAHVPHSTK